jgi:perosamine synthetase
VTDEPLPLARPDIGAREEELVLDVLRSGRLSLGPRLGEFERAFASWLGAPHASAVASGTAGLHLALRAAGVGEGEEVVTSPFSFVASANAILYEGARPVFVDIDSRTLNVDPAAVAAAVTERTSALLPVHIFGYPADVPALERLGRPIVEDACEALGAVHADAVKESIDSERNQGRAPDLGWLDHDRLGFNYRLSDLACALGLAQLERLDELLAARAGVAGLYREALAGLQEVTLPCADEGDERRGWFVFVVQLPHGVDRDATVVALRERGIDSKPYLPAIHLLSFYRERFGHREGEFPVCEDVAARSLALPFFPQMTEGQVARVGEALAEILAQSPANSASGLGWRGS